MPKEYTKSFFNLDIFYPDEFEKFCCDFLSVYLGKEIGYIRNFPEGRDGGIDGYYEDKNEGIKIILQVKKYARPLDGVTLRIEKEKMINANPTSYFFFVSHELTPLKLDFYYNNLYPLITNINEIFDRKRIFEDLKNNQQKYQTIIDKWLNNLAEISPYFKNKQLEIESERKIKMEISLKEQELVIKDIQLNSLINSLENITGNRHFVGIEARTENKPNLSEPIIFSEYYENKVKTYYQTQVLTPEQRPHVSFSLDFSKDGGEQIKKDLELHLKGKKDTVKVTNKFLKKLKLQIQGKTLFEQESNHGDLYDQEIAFELRQPHERIKIRIDPIDEQINYPKLDYLEAIIWRSVETGNLIIENVPSVENPRTKLQFKIEIDLSSDDDSVKLEVLNNNLNNFEEALVYYKLYETILTKKWTLDIVKNSIVQISLPNEKPCSKLSDEDGLIIKKLEIIYRVWKYFERDFRNLRIDEKLFTLEYPYNLDPQTGQTIALLYNKIDNFSFEFNTTSEKFIEAGFINNNFKDIPLEKVKQDLISAYMDGQSLFLSNFEIKPLFLFGKQLTLKISGNAVIKLEKIDDVNIKQIIKFHNPEVNLDIY